MEHRSHSSTYKQGFLCYCQTDFRHASRLRVHLASCQQAASLTIWDDSQIWDDSLRQKEIDTALATADFAILLVSADFLASPFITTVALPRLLHAAQSGEMRILPVIVGHCLFKESVLALYQTVNNPTRPLSLLAAATREQIWVSVVRTLLSTS